MSEPLYMMENSSAGDEEHVNIDSLPDEVLVAIFKKIPLSVRLEHVELVCKRFFTLCRREDVWTRVSLGDDPRWRQRVDFNLLHHIIYFATGARATLHGSVLRPCPIQELDLRHTLCKLSASDVVKLVIRHMPRLKALYACNMSHAHSYRELRYYSQDIQYAVMLLEQHKSNTVLHLDVKLVEEDLHDAHRPTPLHPMMDQEDILMQELERTPPRIIVNGLHMRASRASDPARVMAVLQHVLRPRHNKGHLTHLVIDMEHIDITKALLTDALTNTTAPLTGLALIAHTITSDAVMTLSQLIESGTLRPSRLVLQCTSMPRTVRQLLIRQLAVWLTKTKDCDALTSVEICMCRDGRTYDSDNEILKHLVQTVGMRRATGRVPCELCHVRPVDSELRGMVEQLGLEEVVEWW